MSHSARRAWPRLVSALVAVLILSACSSTDEAFETVASDLTAPTPAAFEFSLEVGQSASGQFTTTNDDRRRVRYKTAVSDTWLSVVSNRSGRLSRGATATIGFRATCPSAPGSYEGTVTVSAKGDTEVVTVGLVCNGETPPPPPPGGGEFEITLVFGATITEAQKNTFRSAAARWSEIIVGDVADIQFNKPAGACGQGEPAFSGTADDVIVYASVEPIDGRGGVLGSAGPCYLRSGSSLPVYGVMRFDSADVGSLGNSFEAVILHEMGHVLGVGTIWERKGLLDYSSFSCQASADPSFSGAAARAEYAALGGSGNVPVENGGGAGTKCGHWDEETFDNELMTGYLGGQTSGNPLSRLTAASLGDVGYAVDLGAADPYQIPGCSPACLRDRDGMIAIAESEILLAPIGAVDENGVIRPLDR